MIPVCLDFETVELLPDGATKASTEAYRENFRVDSAAFSWYDDVTQSIKSLFIRGEAAVAVELAKLAEAQTPLIAHNIQFEILVSRCRFPSLRLNWWADTMRLVQNYDNGGDKFAFEKVETLDDLLDAAARTEGTDSGVSGNARRTKAIPISGLGLVKSVRRILPKEFHDHKREAHDWIRANVPGAKKGKEGQYLNFLPLDILERYNIADTENTLRLFRKITAEFAQLKFEWEPDHNLFLRSVDKIVDAKIRGVRVSRGSLDEYRSQVEKEINQIAVEFRAKFEKEVVEIERQKTLAAVRKRKTLKGRKKYLKKIRTDEAARKKDIIFNIGSNHQLAALFIGQLGMQAKFKTAKDGPSFRSAVLDQWGDGGGMLKKRRKRLLVLKQCESLLALTEHDGRWHCDLKAAGTSTGRYSGGSH